MLRRIKGYNAVTVKNEIVPPYSTLSSSSFNGTPHMRLRGNLSEAAATVHNGTMLVVI